MTCLQILYFFQGREEEEERASSSLWAWPVVVFHSKEVGSFQKAAGICPAASGHSGPLCNFPRWGGSSAAAWASAHRLGFRGTDRSGENARACHMKGPVSSCRHFERWGTLPSSPRLQVHPKPESPVPVPHAPVMWLRKLCRACVRREEIPRRHPRRGNGLLKVLLSGSLYSVIAKGQKSLQRKGYCGPGDFFQVLAVLPGPQTFRSPGLIPEGGVGLRGRVGKAHIHGSPL